MYLPFDTSAALFVGGLFRLVLDRIGANRTEQERLQVEERGTLLASGLVAGEAIMGILLAVMFLAGIPSLTHTLTGTDELPVFVRWGGWLSFLAFALIAWVLIRIPIRAGRYARL
jgi:hypothetical protein